MRATKSPYQDPLVHPPTRRRRGGPIERAVVRATNSARKAGELGDLDLPLIALARSAAASVDLAADRGDAYAVAAGGRQLAAYLDKLHLVDRGPSIVDIPEPAPQPAAGDPLTVLLEQLGTPDQT